MDFFSSSSLIFLTGFLGFHFLHSLLCNGALPIAVEVPRAALAFLGAAAKFL